MKQCVKCLKFKDIDNDFYKVNGYKDKIYIHSWCKECEKELKRRPDIIAAAKEKRQTEEFKCARKEYRKLDYVKQRERDYEEKNKEKRREQKRIQRGKKYKTDILYKLKHLSRIRIKYFLKYNKWRKSCSFKDYIGCSQDELKAHIEKQFTEGMTWDLLMKGKIHIDHIIPLSIAKTEEELYKLCHYTNLQPLWAIDNLKKSNKLIPE